MIAFNPWCRAALARSVSLAVLALAVGCAGPTRWVHPAKTEEDFHRDSVDCDLRAREATRSYEDRADTAFQEARARSLCLQSLGWERSR
jgi:hypothetical protein